MSATSETLLRQPVAYSSPAKTLHWLIVVLMIAQFIIAWVMPDIRRDTQPDTLINLHLSLGALILGLAVVRLGWRLLQGAPESDDGLPPWQVLSSRVTHWLLYLMLFVVPILGWMNASWRGFPVSLFGLLELPKLIATRAPGWGWTGDVHGLVANYAMLAIIGLHTAAALYHHFILRDGVLRRMLPGT